MHWIFNSLRFLKTSDPKRYVSRERDLSVNFRFDVDDVRQIPGLARHWDSEEPFLTPVFFNSEVLVRYFHDPRYTCTFSSESYGQIGALDDSFDLVFGINSNGKVFAWLGDLQKLPVDQQQYLVLENVESDHSVVSDFYEAQINIVYTSPIVEVDILLTKYKLCEAFNSSYGFALFQNTREPRWPDIRKQCSKYKRIQFNDWDDLKRFVSEWYEVLVEDINLAGLRKYFHAAGLELKEDLRELKTFEQFMSQVLKDNKNLVAPLFYLGDLRVWADHRNADKRLQSVLKSLSLEETAKPELLYRTLMVKICEFLKVLQREVVGR